MTSDSSATSRDDAPLPAGWDAPPAVHGPPVPFDRALVIRFGRIGDMLVVTPALRALRRARPSAAIDVLTTEDGLVALSGNPHIRRVIVYRRRRLPAAVNIERARLVRRLRAQRYDVVFLFETAERYRRLARALGSPRVFSFARSDEPATASHAVRLPDRHEGLRFLDVLALGGIPADGVHYDFAIDEDAREAAARLLAGAAVPDGARLAAVHAGHFQRRRRTRPHPKSWPADRYAAVVRGLIGRGMHVVLTGSAAERALNERIIAAAVPERPPAEVARAADDAARPDAAASAAPGGGAPAGETVDAAAATGPSGSGATLPGPRILNFAGRTDLRALAAIIERSDVVVAPDTGPAHLAAAVRTPLVALFGPKAPHIMGPLGDPARIVRLYPEPSPDPEHRRGGHHPRMWAIAVADVLDAVDALLDAGAARPNASAPSVDRGASHHAPDAEPSALAADARAAAGDDERRRRESVAGRGDEPRERK